MKEFPGDTEYRDNIVSHGKNYSPFMASKITGHIKRELKGVVKICLPNLFLC